MKSITLFISALLFLFSLISVNGELFNSTVQLGSSQFNKLVTKNFNALPLPEENQGGIIEITAFQAVFYNGTSNKQYERNYIKVLSVDFTINKPTSHKIVSFTLSNVFEPLILPSPYVINIPKNSSLSMSISYLTTEGYVNPLHLTYFVKYETYSSASTPVQRSTISVTSNFTSFNVPGTGGVYAQKNTIMWQSNVEAVAFQTVASTGVINTTFVNSVTNQLVCKSTPTYNSNGLLVTMSPCTNPTALFKGVGYTITTYYDNSKPLKGVFGSMNVYVTYPKSNGTTTTGTHTITGTTHTTTGPSTTHTTTGPSTTGPSTTHTTTGPSTTHTISGPSTTHTISGPSSSGPSTTHTTTGPSTTHTISGPSSGPSSGPGTSGGKTTGGSATTGGKTTGGTSGKSSGGGAGSGGGSSGKTTGGTSGKSSSGKSSSGGSSDGKSTTTSGSGSSHDGASGSSQQTSGSSQDGFTTTGSSQDGASGSSQQTSGSSGSQPTTGQTSGTSGSQTSAGQTTGQTSGQTSGTSGSQPTTGQTSGQTSGTSGQTTGQTSGTSGQTTGGQTTGQTSGTSGQTTGTSGQTTGQTSGTSGGSSDGGYTSGGLAESSSFKFKRHSNFKKF